jgi:acetyl-CoA carboxylase biotin carboxyl carrier protein
MNLEQLKYFLQIAKAEGVAEIEYEVKDVKLSVSFVGKSHTIATSPVVHHVNTHQPVASQAVNHVEKTTKTDLASGHYIKSPFVGTYYSSAAPGKPKFVKLGDKVKKGQTLCILEAMKIMNEIESDVDGEIIEMLVENESLVEFDQPIFKIKPQ